MVVKEIHIATYFFHIKLCIWKQVAIEHTQLSAGVEAVGFM